MDAVHQKKLAAEKAVEEMDSGMIIGLGTGTTFQFALEKIASKIKNDELKNIIAVPSSKRTEDEAIRLGIPITTLNELYLSEDEKRETGNGSQKSEIRNQKSTSNVQNNLNLSAAFLLDSQLPIDLTIDGADEFDAELNLIKGGGGALLREKILAQASKRLIIITDESKQSKYLGEKWPVPVEVIRMSLAAERNFLEANGAKTKIRTTSDGQPFITDEGNFIIDANFGTIKDVKKIAGILNNRAGIVEHGLFIGLASKVICAMKNGELITLIK